MGKLFPAAFYVASRPIFFCSNINFKSGSQTSNILHKNSGRPNDTTFIKFKIVLTTRCTLFTTLPRTIPSNCTVAFTEISSISKTPFLCLMSLKLVKMSYI